MVNSSVIETALDEIAETAERRDLLLFIGAGTSAAAGLPGWRALADELFGRAQGVAVDTARLNEARDLCERGQLIDALSALEGILGPSEFGTIVERALRDEGVAVPTVLQELAKLAPHVRTVLTTNVDRLVERAFPATWTTIVSSVPDLVQREALIVKLHGTRIDRTSWVFTREQYDRAMYNSAVYRSSFEALIRARKLLFVGFGLVDDDLDLLLGPIRALAGPQPPRHFAIVPSESAPYRKRRLANAGISLLEYDNADGSHSGLLSIIRRVRERCDAQSRRQHISIVPDADYASHTTPHGNLANALGALASEASPAAEPAAGTALDDVLSGASLDKHAAQAMLRGCPRLSLVSSASHRAIRADQRAEFNESIESNRQAWLVADWGMGSREFLASCLELGGSAHSDPDVFLLSCDDLVRADDLEQAFSRQLGRTLLSFCSTVGSLERTFLILENVHPELCTEANLPHLTRIVGALVDYGRTLNVVLVGRLRPPGVPIPLVELAALDVPEVRSYVTAHPDASPELLEAETLERLHARTDGLPMYLDQALRALKVSSLASVLATGTNVLASDFSGSTEATTKALAHAVQSLANAEDRQERRSLRLLKVLTVLPHGETIEALKHYLPTEPFFDGNALHLYERALLEVHVQHAVPDGLRAPSPPGTAPKILRVPRQVRDYVQSTLGSAERNELVFAGLNRFFGEEWREAKIKLRQARSETGDLTGDCLGNEFALLQYVFASGLLSKDEAATVKYCQLGLMYCRSVYSQHRYRDLATASVGLLSSVDRQRRPEVWANLAVLAGRGLRMTGHHEEALAYLRDALEYDGLSKDDRASVWLNISLAEASRAHAPEAVAAARQVEALVAKNCGDWYQAQTILIDSLQSGRERARSLVRLEREARSNGYKTAADNIALDLAREASDPKAQWRYHDRVLKSEEFGYNQVRAAVGKARSLQRAGRAGLMARADLVVLARAYSYLHAQRLSSLFESCHEALWTEFESRDETQQLLRLFRHTSFLWRIRGRADKESEYISRLQKRSVERAEPKARSRLVDELQYFWSRVKAVLG